MNKILLIHKLSLIFTLSILTGCATAPIEKQISADMSQAARTATVFVVIPQDELYADVMTSSSGAGLGLIGAILDARVNYHKHSIMKSVTNSIQGLFQISKINTDLHAALTGSGIFVDSTKVHMVDPAPTSEEELRQLINSAPAGPVVVVEYRYQLDATLRVFIAQSRVRLWENSHATDTPIASTTYYSAPVRVGVGQKVTERYADTMASLWTADDARSFRKSYSESLTETIEMLKTAIIDRPSSLKLTDDKAMKYIEYAKPPVVRRFIVKREAKVLRGKENRAILITDSGRIISTQTGPTFKTAGLNTEPAATGKGRVFIYYPFGLAEFGPTVYVNGKEPRDLDVETFIFMDMTPGEYSFSLKHEGDSLASSLARSKFESVTPVHLDVKSGERYFIKFDGYNGIWTKSDALKLMTHARLKVKLSHYG